MSAKSIALRGFFQSSAKAIATFGYFGGASFDTSAVVHGLVFGPQASGIVTGASATGDIDAPAGYGVAIGPQTSGAVEGPGETWH